MIEDVMVSLTGWGLATSISGMRSKISAYKKLALHPPQHNTIKKPITTSNHARQSVVFGRCAGS